MRLDLCNKKAPSEVHQHPHPVIEGTGSVVFLGTKDGRSSHLLAWFLQIKRSFSKCVSVTGGSLRSDCPTPKQSHTSFTPSSTATTSTSSSARSRWSTPLWERWEFGTRTGGPGNRLGRRPQTNPALCCSSAGGLLPSCPSLQERQRRLATGSGTLLDVLPQGPPQLLRAGRLLLLLWRPAVVDQRAADQPPASSAGSLHHAGKQVRQLNTGWIQLQNYDTETYYAKSITNSFTHLQSMNWKNGFDALMRRVFRQFDT